MQCMVKWSFINSFFVRGDRCYNYHLVSIDLNP